MMKIRILIQFILATTVALSFLNSCRSGISQYESAERPNILFCIADDWGWPHAGPYGDPVVKTPTFDRLAKEGVLFEHAFVSSPSCTPSRSALLTGQYHWRLEESANLWSTLDANIPVYPLLLEDDGYFVGHWRKSWGPGDITAGGYTDRYPAGKIFNEGFRQFLEARPDGTPFCFWLGASDPHRPYKEGSGKESGLDISRIIIPGFFPDVEEIRSDIADYYFEVQRFDNDVSDAISLLEEIGELDSTIIVMTGDHGMPFPRCKGNLYDMGSRVPLAIRWGNTIAGERVIKDFVSFTDLAPTFLEAAGVQIPEVISGKSLLPALLTNKSGWIDKDRNSVVFGRERHTPAQLSPSMGGYPSRAIRTAKYLYIRNIEPGRWPAGVPDNASHPMNSYTDCDNGPTKTFIVENGSDTTYTRFYNWSFAKRPYEELYVISDDPYQLNNVADNPDFKRVKNRLSRKLDAILEETKDPRIIGGGEKFDSYPYRSAYKLTNNQK